jgi:hypothetical protein
MGFLSDDRYMGQPVAIWKSTDGKPEKEMEAKQ